MHHSELIAGIFKATRPNTYATEDASRFAGREWQWGEMAQIAGIMLSRLDPNFDAAKFKKECGIKDEG